MRAELSKAQGRRNLTQQSDHVNVFDASFGIRIVFTPQPDKLVEMVGAQNGPIPGQVVKVIHDDGNEQVENEEGTDNEKGDEIRVGEIGTTTRRISGIFGKRITYDRRVFFARQHDFLPSFTGGRPKEN